MGKIKKRFKDHLDEFEGCRKPKKVKSESRHNYKVHLEDAIENEQWDDLDNEDIFVKRTNL